MSRMSWFVAHAVVYFRLKQGVQRSYWVYENLHLIEAGSFEDAEVKAARIASQSAGDDRGTLTLDGMPAERVFLGIRKIVSCENPDEPPRDGDELTYNEFEVTSWEALQDLAAGKPTPLQYEARDQADQVGGE